jgi:hypothetical protein
MQLGWVRQRASSQIANHSAYPAPIGMNHADDDDELLSYSTVKLDSVIVNRLDNEAGLCEFGEQNLTCMHNFWGGPSQYPLREASTPHP